MLDGVWICLVLKCLKESERFANDNAVKYGGEQRRDVQGAFEITREGFGTDWQGVYQLISRKLSWMSTTSG